MSDSKLLKIILGGAAVGAAAAAVIAYKKQCDEFSAELDDEFEEVDSDEPETERSYSDISIEEEKAAETVSEE